jgi:eukaryotic translation initiation factor 2C
MIDKKFYSPATVENWFVVVYERPGRFEQAQVNDMVQGLIQAGRDVGK